MSVETEIREQRELLAQMDRGDSAREEHEVDCKAYGCPKEAIAEKGPYAGLCDEHTEIARQKLSDQRSGRSRGGGSAKASSNGKGFAGQIKVLLGLARRVDRAHDKLGGLTGTDELKASLEEAIRRYQGVQSLENLTALQEATKAMQKGHLPRVRGEQELEEARREFKTELAAVARRAAS